MASVKYADLVMGRTMQRCDVAQVNIFAGRHGQSGSAFVCATLPSSRSDVCGHLRHACTATMLPVRAGATAPRPVGTYDCCRLR